MTLLGIPEKHVTWSQPHPAPAVDSILLRHLSAPGQSGCMLCYIPRVAAQLTLVFDAHSRWRPLLYGEKAHRITVVTLAGSAALWGLTTHGRGIPCLIRWLRSPWIQP